MPVTISTYNHAHVFAAAIGIAPAQSNPMAEVVRRYPTPYGTLEQERLNMVSQAMAEHRAASV